MDEGKGNNYQSKKIVTKLHVKSRMLKIRQKLYQPYGKRASTLLNQSILEQLNINQDSGLAMVAVRIIVTL